MVFNHFIEDDGSGGPLIMEVIESPQKETESEENLSVCPFLSQMCRPSPLYLLPSTSSKDEQSTPNQAKPLAKAKISGKYSEVNFSTGQPLELSWELIMKITSGFSTRAWNGREKNFRSAYVGRLSKTECCVLVKTLGGH